MQVLSRAVYARPSAWSVTEVKGPGLVLQFRSEDTSPLSRPVRRSGALTLPLGREISWRRPSLVSIYGRGNAPGSFGALMSLVSLRLRAPSNNLCGLPIFLGEPYVHPPVMMTV
jgi:hypothetical protein